MLSDAEQATMQLLGMALLCWCTMILVLVKVGSNSCVFVRLMGQKTNIYIWNEIKPSTVAIAQWLTLWTVIK